MSYVFRRIFYGTMDFLILIGALIGIYELIKMHAGESDILKGIFVMICFCLFFLIKLILSYQVDPAVGFFRGVKMGFSDLINYIKLLVFN